MDQGKRKLATSLLAAASLTTTAASLKAATYAEPGDAGQTLAAAATATPAFNGTAAGLTQITGSIGTGTDADLYAFTLSAATTLQISANGGTSSVANSGPIDTSLFLFDSTGKALVANDDRGGTVSGTNYQGQFTLSLAAGTYYLGISLSGNEPINSASQFMFTQTNAGTDVRGPNTLANPATLGTFNNNSTFPETGTYTIGLAAAPEPATNATLALGAAAIGLTLVRRLRRPQAEA